MRFPIYILRIISHTTDCSKGALEEEGRAEQHIITKAASNELKLGGGAQKSDESWPSATRWRREVFVRRRWRKPYRRYGVF